MRSGTGELRRRTGYFRNIFRKFPQPLRLRDLDLGGWLAYERPVAIRKLFRENHSEIEALGVISTVRITSGPREGRRGEEFWLTQEQAIALCQLSQTPRATQVRIMLRRMFLRSRQGALLPVTPRAVVDSEALDRLEVVVAQTSADATALCAVVAATHAGLGERRGRDNRENIPELTVADLDANLGISDLPIKADQCKQYRIFPLR